MSSVEYEFGERLRAKREALGLSQAAFAEMAGVHRRSQINYETGKREPPISYFDALHRAGIDVSDLLDWAGIAVQELKAAAYFQFLSTVVTLLGLHEEKLQAALDEAYKISIECLNIKGSEPYYDKEKLTKKMNILAMKLLQDEGICDFS